MSSPSARHCISDIIRSLILYLVLESVAANVRCDFMAFSYRTKSVFISTVSGASGTVAPKEPGELKCVSVNWALRRISLMFLQRR